MTRPRPPRALLAGAVAVAVLGLAACGPEGERGDEARKTLEKGKSATGLREGLIFPVDGIHYNVTISRQLNVRDPEDRQYYQGPEPPPESTFLGVFIRACNPGASKRARQLSRSIAVVDTQENRFTAIPLPDTNPFSYQPVRLAPGECLPEASSATNFGPTGGVMLLYQLPLSSLENRPLELEIEGVYNAMTGERQTAAVELDL